MTRLARRPPVLLGAAALVAFALLLALGSNVAFFIDDWNVLLGRTGSFADTYLDPYNGHPSMSLVGTYRLLQTTVGMDSIVPFFVVSLLAFVASGLILFLWMRSRVGDWLALAASISILFLGSASEDLLITFQLGYFVPAACGIGCFLALERETRAGDIAACGLLLVALTFSGLGLPFLVGAAVAIALGARPLARLWVVAVPAALFALWYVGGGHDDSVAEPGLANLAAAPGFALDGIAASISALLGLTVPREGAELSPLDWGRPLLVVAAIGAVVLVRLRRRRLSRWLWAVLATLLAYWLSIAINAGEFRQPFFSRYLYPGGVLLVMLAAELFRGIRPSRPVLIGAFALLAVTVAGNLAALRADYLDRRLQAEAHGGAFAALDIAADSVDPAMTFDDRTFPFFGLPAGAYLAAAAKYGSLGYSLEELATAPESGRVAADNALAASHRLTLSEPTGSEPSPKRCVTPDLAPTGTSEVELGPGTISIRAFGETPVEITMRRFATASSPIALGAVGRAPRVLEIPTDRATQPWTLHLAGSGSARVCRLP